MKKIDLHIHTVSTISDSSFVFRDKNRRNKVNPATEEEMQKAFNLSPLLSILQDWREISVDFVQERQLLFKNPTDCEATSIKGQFYPS